VSVSEDFSVSAVTVAEPKLRNPGCDWVPVGGASACESPMPEDRCRRTSRYGTTFPGNRRSHCTISPDTHVMRSVGQVGRNNGRN
jgi:hypothetical protein